MNIINNLIAGMDNVKMDSVTSRSFQPGQIFNGRILKLYPNDIAALQIGSQKVVAQLEASLDVQQRYWFQVQPGEGKVKLKVIGAETKGSMVEGEAALNSKILKELSMPANRENMDTLRFFLKEQLPVNKENIQSAHQWMKESNSSQLGQEVIKMLHQKGLPMTKAAFQAIYTVLENESLSQSIELLQSQLGKHPLSQSGNRLLQFLQSMRESQEMLGGSLKESVIASDERIQQLAQWVKESSSLQVGEETIKLMRQKQLPMTKAVFQAIYASLENEPVKSLNSQLETHSLSQSRDRLAQDLQSSSNQEAIGLSAVKNIINESVFKTTTQAAPSDSPSFVHFFKEITKSMGFSYESTLVNHFNHYPDEQNIKTETLKSLLIDFVQETPAGTIKEAAEKILNKITGFQLLGQESGPVQQFVFQIPIALQNRTMDITIQWSGRKTKSGEIDPSFCRVLFYLELENLHDTMVDMQVQNRVISITVMNENEHIKEYASPFIRPLKEKLEMMDYTLSFVHFTHLSEVNQEKQKQNPYVGLHSYSGVDLRI